MVKKLLHPSKMSDKKLLRNIRNKKYKNTRIVLNCIKCGAKLNRPRSFLCFFCWKKEGKPSQDNYMGNSYNNNYPHIHGKNY